MTFGRATTIACLAFVLAGCQATIPPGSQAPTAVAASASPTARPPFAPPAGSDAVRPPAFTPSPTPASAEISHVVVVWMENREASAVTASSMPYLYRLSERYGRADEFYAVTHPSLPNYLAFWSGSTQGVTDDADHNLEATSLSNQLTTAGRSWRIYAQDYPPGGCNTAGSYSGGVDGPGVAGTYARKHNPAMSFTFVSGSSQCANVQPLASFDPSVNVAFVVPNLCNDMHDCSPARGDAFLQAFLPRVLTAPEWAHTLLVVSFDEGTSNANGGGKVFTMVARQGLASVISSTTHDHYGLLRTIEDIFGLPCLEASCGATPLDEFLP
jgi:phosphatidylinositol-3-phosphatase